MTEGCVAITVGTASGRTRGDCFLLGSGEGEYRRANGYDTFVPFQWGYAEDHPEIALVGPGHWYQTFPPCGTGNYTERQSPINIETASLVYNSTLPSLNFSYQATNSSQCMQFNNTDLAADVQCDMLRNTGHGLYVEFQRQNASRFSSITGGPLVGTYHLAQMHWHWGESARLGSEHTVDNRSYPAELHMVHWNEKYETYEEAFGYEDGIAVVGVMVDVGAAHSEWTKLEQFLPAVHLKEQDAVIKTFGNEFDVRQFLPRTASTHFVTYPGSLTTPACTEVVTWLVLRDPITMSAAQWAAFGSLSKEASENKTAHIAEPIGWNFRPVQPLNGRTVYASFKPTQVVSAAAHNGSGLAMLLIALLSLFHAAN